MEHFHMNRAIDKLWGCLPNMLIYKQTHGEWHAGKRSLFDLSPACYRDDSLSRHVNTTRIFCHLNGHKLHAMPAVCVFDFSVIMKSDIKVISNIHTLALSHRQCYTLSTAPHRLDVNYSCIDGTLNRIIYSLINSRDEHIEKTSTNIVCMK